MFVSHNIATYKEVKYCLLREISCSMRATDAVKRVK